MFDKFIFHMILKYVPTPTNNQKFLCSCNIFYKKKIDCN